MIGQTNIGLTYKLSDISENGTMVLRSSNIINGKLNFDDLVRVNTRIKDNQLVKNNDILICARNGSKALVGKCAFMAIYRTSLYKYVFYYLNSEKFRNIFLSGNSTTINQLTQAMIKFAVMSLPPLNEQKRILDKVSTLFKVLDNIEKSLS